MFSKSADGFELRPAESREGTIHENTFPSLSNIFNIAIAKTCRSNDLCPTRSVHLSLLHLLYI